MIIRKSKKKAAYLLKVQKEKTGVAIPGTPINDLTNNPIFQSDHKRASLEVGEDLALKAFTAKKIILYTAGIEHDKHFKYTGRSQYPHFAIEPLVRSIEEFEFFSCPRYFFWALFQNVHAMRKQDIPTKKPRS